MDKEEIEEQLKISKRQNEYERYEYLCSGFNAINYCVKLERYTNKLQQENKKLKENYDRIYNENCILREKHNINDIGLLDENYRLKQAIDKAIEYNKKNIHSQTLYKILKED